MFTANYTIRCRSSAVQGHVLRLLGASYALSVPLYDMEAALKFLARIFGPVRVQCGTGSCTSSTWWFLCTFCSIVRSGRSIEVPRKNILSGAGPVRYWRQTNGVVRLNYDSRILSRNNF